MEHCLVLNRNYIAIGVVNFRRAISMLFKGRAEVVEVANKYYENYNFSSWAELSAFKVQNNITEDNDRLIYTGEMTLIIPTVVRTLFYDGVVNGSVKMTRRNIYARDDYTCGYCGNAFRTEDLNIDHIVPRSKGGKNEWENVICSCIKCNSRKNDRTPEEAGMKLLKKPYRPRYNVAINHEASFNRYFKTWGEFVSYLYWDTQIEQE